jgi:hypothetical protein
MPLVRVAQFVDVQSDARYRGYPPSMTQQTGQGMPPPTTSVARQQASDVGHTAADAGRDVAATAGEQAGHVAREVNRQARDLLGEARSQATQQARTGQNKAEESIRELASELREMADNGDHHGTASELAVQAADRLHGVADWIGDREPGDLVEEVRRFARRRPGAFLLGAAVAGMLVGRLTRGAVDAQRDTGTDAHHRPDSYPSDATTPFPAAPPPAGPPPTYDPLLAAGRPTGRPAGTSRPAPGVPNGDPFAGEPVPPTVPPTVPPVAPPPAAAPTAPHREPQHAPRPGSMTVGEYVEQPERDSGPYPGGAR